MSSIITRKVVSIFQEKRFGFRRKFYDACLIRRQRKKGFKFIGKGFLYTEIVEQLDLSAETVKKHVYHIYDKLHVRNRLEAINIS